MNRSKQPKYIQDLRIQQLKSKIQMVNDFQKIQNQCEIAKLKYLQTKDQDSLRRYHYV